MMRACVATLVVTIALGGAGASYLWYRFGEIRTLPCAACAPVQANRAFDVLLLGADSDVAVSAAHPASNRSDESSDSGFSPEGQWSDAIEVVHLDPRSGRVSLLSIPRATYVTPANGSRGDERASTELGSVFRLGPDAVVRTVSQTFGIPISHFAVFDFSSVIGMVDAVGGISLNFPYPVRDDDNGVNNAGLTIRHSGCQSLPGSTALALARSRYFQYEAPGQRWVADPTGDLGRVRRQDAVVEETLDRFKSSYNPLSINAFLSSLVAGVTVDSRLSFGDLISIAGRLHGLEMPKMKTWVLPTTAEYSPRDGLVQVVSESAANRVVTEFLDGRPNRVVDAPPDANGLSSTLNWSTSSAISAGQTFGSQSINAAAFDPEPC